MQRPVVVIAIAHAVIATVVAGGSSLLLAGCADRPPAADAPGAPLSPAPPPSPAAPPPAAALEADAAPAAAPPAVVDVAAPDERRLPARVLALARDRAALRRAFDPRRGVSLAWYTSDESGEEKTDADGALKGAEKLCSRDEVARSVRLAIEVKEVPGSGTCDGTPLVCVVRGSHHFDTHRLTFEGATDDHVGTLVSIEAFSEVLASDAWVARAEAYLADRIRALGPRRCGS